MGKEQEKVIHFRPREKAEVPVAEWFRDKELQQRMFELAKADEGGWVSLAMHAVQSRARFHYHPKERERFYHQLEVDLAKVLHEQPLDVSIVALEILRLQLLDLLVRSFAWGAAHSQVEAVDGDAAEHDEGDESDE